MLVLPAQKILFVLDVDFIYVPAVVTSEFSMNWPSIHGKTGRLMTAPSAQSSRTTNSSGNEFTFDTFCLVPGTFYD